MTRMEVCELVDLLDLLDLTERLLVERIESVLERCELVDLTERRLPVDRTESRVTNLKPSSTCGPSVSVPIEWGSELA